MAFFREFTAESCRRALPLPKGSVGLLSSADDDTGRGAQIIVYYDMTSYLLILGFITDGRFAGEFTQRRLVHQVCSSYRRVGERRRMSRKALARPISESVFNESAIAARRRRLPVYTVITALGVAALFLLCLRRSVGNTTFNALNSPRRTAFG